MGNLNDENDEYLVTRLLNNIFNLDILIENSTARHYH